MTALRIPAKHISRKLSPIVQEMVHMQNRETPIRYFDYQRIYHASSELMCLTSNINFLRDRIQLDECFVEPSLSEGIYLADEVFPTKEIALDHEHNMFTGICIVNQQKQYTETAFFAADDQNKQCISFYLNNTQYLYSFVKKFKEKFHDIFVQDEIKIKVDKKLLSERNDIVCSMDDKLNLLSYQEKIVLSYYLKGRTQSDIATQLNISRSSVSTYIHRLMRKLKCRNRAELIDIACHHGMISFC